MHGSRYTHSVLLSDQCGDNKAFCRRLAVMSLQEHANVRAETLVIFVAMMLFAVHLFLLWLLNFEPRNTKWKA